MNGDDLRKFLDAHGSPGAPPQAPGGAVYVIERGLGDVGIELGAWGRGWLHTAANPDSGIPTDRIVRHAPLPPLAGRFVPCSACADLRPLPADAIDACVLCGPASHPLAAPGVRFEVTP